MRRSLRSWVLPGARLAVILLLVGLATRLGLPTRTSLPLEGVADEGRSLLELAVVPEEPGLPPFLIERFEVTNAQYARFVAATGHRAPLHFLAGLPPRDEGEHPVVHVSLADAAAYARWRGRRLPSAEEWRRAARGGGAWKQYPWGKSFVANQCNSWSTDLNRTTPVGTFESGKNALGCYDLAGNVAEWTTSPARDARGFPVPGRRVVLGGSFRDSEELSFAIDEENPAMAEDGENFNDALGFRCVADVDAASVRELVRLHLRGDREVRLLVEGTLRSMGTHGARLLREVAGLGPEAEREQAQRLLARL